MNISAQKSELIPKPLLWALWMLALSIAFKLFSVFTVDYDLWFHLFLGREAFANGKINRLDLYSFTAYGLPVINHEWLADIIITGFYKLLGQNGLILWRQMMVLAIVLAALRLIRRETTNVLSQVLTFLCFVVVIAPGISFRVQLFSYLFILILFNLICDRTLKAKSLSLILTLLFLIWANIHGAFVLGLLIWYIHLLGQIARRSYKLNWITCTLFIAPLLATLINPYNIKLWAFIYRELSNPINSRYITEWRRFSFEARELAFAFVFMATWFAFLFSKGAKRAPETIILILASIMGFMAVRHTPLFVILTLPSMAYHFDELIKRIQSKTARGRPAPALANYITVFFIFIATVYFLYQSILQPWKIRTDTDPLPYQTVQYLKDTSLKGNLWTPLHWGSYALFHLYPDFRVSIDGRWAMLYPRKVMQDNIDFAYNGMNGRWKKILKKYKADFALVEMGNDAIWEMKNDPNWVWFFEEKTCALLVRRDILKTN